MKPSCEMRVARIFAKVFSLPPVCVNTHVVFVCLALGWQLVGISIPIELAYYISVALHRVIDTRMFFY